MMAKDSLNNILAPTTSISSFSSTSSICLHLVEFGRPKILRGEYSQKRRPVNITQTNMFQMRSKDTRYRVSLPLSLRIAETLCAKAR